jgi:hypothetical protein
MRQYRPLMTHTEHSFVRCLSDLLTEIAPALSPTLSRNNMRAAWESPLGESRGNGAERAVWH